jgi:hypothetical protein
VKRIGRGLLPSRGLPAGALVIGLVSATGLIPVSAQRLVVWSVVPSPNIKPHRNGNEFNAVSCVSATDCIAVGDEYGGNPESALAESWNGTKWSVVPSPDPVHRALYGVSCTSAAACTAVGFNIVDAEGDTTPLVESWNGAKWSVIPNPGLIGMQLTAVSCVSPTACMAVGTQINSKGDFLPFTESWNGTKWSIVPSPNKGDGEEFLSGVSCVSPTACTAVGGYGFDGLLHSGPLVESWNGTRWSIVPSPNNKGKTGSLNGVFCTSVSFCVAVGTYLSPQLANNKTLIETWNGTRWTAEPAIKGFSKLSGVSCVSGTDCWAVGNSWNSAFVTRTFAEYWNGRRWCVEPTPNAGPASYYNNLIAVSCPTVSSCAAVGNYGNYGNNGPEKTLTEIGTRGR